MLVDLPLSFALDTALLPYTVPMTIIHMHGATARKCRADPGPHGKPATPPPPKADDGL